MNNKRNKRGPVRAQRNRSVATDGVYSNPNFMFVATSHIGTVVRLKTKAEEVWEGVFKTFSSNFDVVLEVATLIGKMDNPAAGPQVGSLVDRMIFQVNDIVSLSMQDVDTQFATRDTFQTDGAISAKLNGANLEEKELEPWDGDMNGMDAPLELDNSANGWDANDMFKKNEMDYGVTSTYDHTLKGYTVPLQHSDSPDYKEFEAKATMIANEIESQPSRKARLELENGDEEAIYAAVVRPSEPNGKYIPPAKRKNQNSSKASRNSPPPTASSSQTQSAASSSNVAMTTPQATSSKGAQTSPVSSYTQTPPNNAPPQHMPPPQVVPPPMNQAPPQTLTPVPQQVPAQAQLPAVQNQGHQPRQGHGYRQKGHMNGEAKQMRGVRNVYQSGPPPNVPPQVQHPPPNHQVQAYQGAEMNNHNRIHRDEVKDLQQFSQDFQLAKEAHAQGPPPQQQPPVPEQKVVMPPLAALHHNHKPQPEVPVPQPTPSPQQDEVDKVANALKGSTLNPNAKEFKWNPTVGPFTPRLVTERPANEEYPRNTFSPYPYNYNSRAPSTPSLSGPHTPQTPSHAQFIAANMNGAMGPQPTSMMVPMSYMMPGQAQYAPPPPQGDRMGELPAGQLRQGDLSSMQVAAATGQPLLAPAPMGQFVYQPAMNPAHYQHIHRMYEAPPQLQYLPPQVSQAGGQPGQPQYAQGQPPQAPPQQYQAAPPPQGGVQAHSYMPMCNLIPQPHMLQGMQYLQQVPPPPNHHIPLILHNQQHQVHQGPA